MSADSDCARKLEPRSRLVRMISTWRKPDVDLKFQNVSKTLTMNENFRTFASSQRDDPIHTGISVWWVIFLSLVFRIAFAASIGLGIDEVYMVTAGRELQLSYFDHPPIAWWMTWIASNLSGSLAPVVLRLPFILLFVVSTWLLYSLTSVLFGERAGFWAAVILSISPIFGVVFGSWVLPDGPLMAATLAAVLCLAKLFFIPGTPAALYWAGAGFFGGLALLSKYHAVFLFAGTFLFLLTSGRERRWLKRPWPYIGLAIAIALFTPVLVWNAQHEWVSFDFHRGRSAFETFRPIKSLEVIGLQALFLAPWIWIPIVIATYHALRRGPADGRSWFLICLGIVPPVFFTLVASWSLSQILAHWMMPGYLMLIPLLGAAIARYEVQSANRTRLLTWIWGSVLFLLIATLVVSTELRFGWLDRVVPAITVKNKPIKELLNKPFKELLYWGELETALQDRGLLNRRNLFVIAPKWHEAARAAYALDGDIPVLCISSDRRNFDVFRKLPAYDKEDALIIGKNLSNDTVENLYGDAFQSIKELPPVTIHHAGRPAILLSIFYASHFDARALNRLKRK